MIISKIYGGLGNQLFQYSLGRACAKKYSTELFLDLSFYELGKNSHPFVLDKFNVEYKLVTEREYQFLYTKNNYLRWKINNQYQKLLKYYNRKYILERKMGFDKNILKIKNNSILDGYWHSPVYFDKIVDVLKEELTLKEESPNPDFKLLKSKISAGNTISIHVRRGDYLKYNVELCSLDYYKTAIDMAANHIGNSVFFIFSDDIEWCKQNFQFGHEFIFIEKKIGLMDYEEFLLMSYCKHNIIANSTFSWWAAWLNSNKTKQVFYPKFALNVYKDIMFPDWIGI